MSPASGSQRPHGILFVALLIIGVGNSMLQPLLPPLARELKLPDASIGFIFSLSALFWVVASPFWGRRSDRVGRRPTVALGMAAFALSMGLVSVVVVIGRGGWLAPAAVFVLLMLARAIFGAVGSATAPAAQAYIADRCEPSELIERLAALNAAFALGAAAGPALCALIAGKFGLVTPIALTAFTAAIASWLVWRLLPEPELPKAPARTGSEAAAQWALAMSPRFVPFLLFGFGLSMVTGTLQQTYTLFLMDRLHVAGAQAAEQAAAGFIANATALLLAQIVILPRLKLTARPLMLIGAALVLVGVGVQAIAFDLTWLVVCCFIQGIGFGLARAGFAGGAMAVTDKRGAAAGLIVSANGTGFVFSPITGGVVYDFVHPLAPLAICGIVLAAMAAHIHFTRAS